MPKKKRKSQFGKHKTVGYGYVGRWHDDTLGRLVPKRLHYGTNMPYSSDIDEAEELTLCKITIEESPNPKGKLVKRPLVPEPQMTDKERWLDLISCLDLEFEDQDVTFANPTRRVDTEYKISTGGCNAVCIGFNADGSMQYMDIEHGC